MTTLSNVPFFSAAVVNREFDLESAVTRVVRSHWYILGKEVEQFEREFAAYIGVQHCVSVANGTDAITCALRAVGVKRSDTVALVANAGFYGSTALHAIGAEPLYVDVDAATLTMSVTELERALQSKPKAVIVTHLYGQLADIAAIAALCKRHDVPLIEDCAQSHGATQNGGQAGSFGDVAAFSFYPTKNLGALGDGGAVATNNPALADKLKQLRQYGWGKKYQVDVAHGGNSRLDEMQAAVLRTKLPALDSQNAVRRALAAKYNAAFANTPLRLPASLGPDYVAHLYVVRTPQRAALLQHLQSQGIGCDIHYPIADYRQPAYHVDAPQKPLPVTQEACDTVISLPCYPGMTDAQVDAVISSVTAFFDAEAVR